MPKKHTVQCPCGAEFTGVNRLVAYGKLRVHQQQEAQSKVVHVLWAEEEEDAPSCPKCDTVLPAHNRTCPEARR